MYTVQIQRYSINTDFPAALQAAGLHEHYTFYLHLQQNTSKKKIYCHSHKGHVVKEKQRDLIHVFFSKIYFLHFYKI